MSGLICGENSNPLAVFALTAEGTRVHVMSWPNYFPTSGDPMRIRVAVDSQAFAQISKAYVVSACGVVDDDMIRKLDLSPDQEEIVRDSKNCGGSVIVAPNLQVIAGPMGAEEGILYADCDLELCVAMKLRHDFAGHYNRPDIFQLHINRTAPQLYTVHDEQARALPSSQVPLVMEPLKRLANPQPPSGDMHRGLDQAPNSQAPLDPSDS
jgi:aliphatic nitrilase